MYYLNRMICCFAGGILLAGGIASADTVTTPLTFNNGQAGNMFNLNVTATDGLTLQSFGLNLDAGDWDVDLYTRPGTYVGNESSSLGWTLFDSVTDLVSATPTGTSTGGPGPNPITTWDTADLVIPAGLTAFYINVTNGTGLNYTTAAGGVSEGDVAASDANVEILVGTGNQANFGGQFRPRIFSGSIEYELNAVAVPEPNTGLAFAMIALATGVTRRRR